MKNKIIGAILLFFITTTALLIMLSSHIEPLELKAKVFNYEYGRETVSTDISEYINANESVIEVAKLNLSKVKNKVGKYSASISYMGKKYPFQIKIVDTTKPIATLKQVQFNIAVNTILKAIDLLESVEDSSAVTAYFQNKDGSLEEEKGFTKKESYIENIIVIDSSNNRSARLRVKIVAGTGGSMPTIEGINDKEIKVGKDFDPLRGVKATDGKGKEITDRIKILKNSVNIEKKGIYEVIYTVTNDSGNTIQRSRKVVVIK